MFVKWWCWCIECFKYCCWKNFSHLWFLDSFLSSWDVGGVMDCNNRILVSGPAVYWIAWLVAWHQNKPTTFSDMLSSHVFIRTGASPCLLVAACSCSEVADPKPALIRNFFAAIKVQKTSVTVLQKCCLQLSSGCQHFPSGGERGYVRGKCAS